MEVSNKNLSIIIPTLKKNVEVLKNLIINLENDSSIDEIIIIDNTGEGFDNDFKKLSSKLQIVINKQNEFVNPCWNKGIEMAKNEYWGLLNDDIIIPKNFCSKIIKHLNPKFGIIGIDKNIVENNSAFNENEVFFDDTIPKLVKVKYRNLFFGIMLFGHKNSYYKIPEEMKVWCGDDFLFLMNEKNSKRNYKITNSKIYHMHSLTSSCNSFDNIKQNDIKICSEYFPEWDIEKINSKQLILNIYNEDKHKVFAFLGIKFKFKYSKSSI